MLSNLNQMSLHIVGYLSHDQGRTVARKFSIGGLCVCAGGLDTLKIDKNSTDLQCFVFQFGEVSSFVWGAKPLWRRDSTRVVVGWEHVGTAFLYLFLVWERGPISFCASNGT